MKDFEKYWSQYGELHASMCNGDIKQFAKEIWKSVFDEAKLREAVLWGYNRAMANVLLKTSNSTEELFREFMEREGKQDD